MSSQSSSTPQYFQTMSMSTSPPAPKPSNPPPDLVGSRDQQPPTPAQTLSSTSPSSSSSKHPHFPAPKLRLELRDLSNDSTHVFLTNFNPSKDLPNLVQTVLKLLYTTDYSRPAEQEPTTLSTATAATTTTTTTSASQAPLRPSPPTPRIPQTRSVTLIVRDMDGVAYTTGSDLDDDHKEIHLSLSYIAYVSRSRSTPSAIRHELLGVICHELVHCFQWNAIGTAPGGLVEGIADWVRLNAGFVPPHWKKNVDGEWDRGYQNTGYFLDWIEQTVGRASVLRLNQALCNKKYNEDEFWIELFGESVGELYKRYGKALTEKEE